MGNKNSDEVKERLMHSTVHCDPWIFSLILLMEFCSETLGDGVFFTLPSHEPPQLLTCIIPAAVAPDDFVILTMQPSADE